MRTPPDPRALIVVLVAACPCLACGDGGSSTGPDGLPPVPGEATAWLDGHVEPLTTTDPVGPLTDLEPLREMVGDARVVALGEATHGTREFHRLRHRIIRFLVAEMGFDRVAVEAPWAESRRVDEWILGAEGDPEVLLSGLYGWHVNTREVLEVVRWMRERNGSAGEDAVRFSGFDMQYPGMAIHNVREFVTRVDSGASDRVAEGLECLERFANDPSGRFPSPGYADQLREAYRIPCRESLEGVKALLEDREVEYVAAAGREAWERAVRSARLVLQFEEWATALTGNLRDPFMAENAAWILDRMEPDQKLLIWAHNDHVSRMPGSMVRALEEIHGHEVLAVALTFSQGSFQAETPTDPTPRVHRVEGPIPRSYGHYFGAAGVGAFLLQLGGREYAGEGSSWVAGPRTLRSVGLDYDPEASGAYAYPARLPEEFDVVAWVRESSPSRLLTFRYPQEF